MSVLKPGHTMASAIRPFRFGGEEKAAASLAPVATQTHSAGQPQQGEKPRKQDERLALARRISELEAALEEHSAKAAKDRETAREEGRKDGKDAAEKQDAERFETLRKAIETSRSDALKALEMQRSLAVDIARATIGQILGDESAFTGLVTETAAYWKAKLAGAAVLKVRVSQADFSDEQALHSLRANLGNLDLDVDPELAPGACVFDLQLGEVDASIPVQAGRADALLAEHGSGQNVVHRAGVPAE